MYNACAKGEHRNAIQEEPLATIIHAGDIFARNEAKSNGLDLVMCNYLEGASSETTGFSK